MSASDTTALERNSDDGPAAEGSTGEAEVSSPASINTLKVYERGYLPIQRPIGHSDLRLMEHSDLPGHRPVDLSHFEVFAMLGKRPIGASELQIVEMLGNRPIMASGLQIMPDAYPLPNNRPVASNDLGPEPALMGYLD